jgi:oligopeptide/dipeptide ABC transporter ATP-binding protein
MADSIFRNTPTIRYEGAQSDNPLAYRWYERSRIVLGGDVPSPIDPPPGCPFHPRCPVAVARCRTELPVLRQVGPGRDVACHIAG